MRLDWSVWLNPFTSLRSRGLLLCAGSALAVTVVFLMIADYYVASEKISHYTDTLDLTHRLFQAQLEERYDRLHLAASSVGRDPSLQAMLLRERVGYVDRFIDYQKRVYKIDRLILINQSGQVVVDTEKNASAEDFSFLLPVAEPHGAKDVWVNNGVIYQISVVPVKGLSQRNMAYLVAGKIVDAALARSLRDLTGVEVSFFTSQVLSASTMDSFMWGALLSEFTAFSGRENVMSFGERFLNDVPHLEAWLALGQRRAYVVFHKSLLDPLMPLQRVVKALALFGFFLVFVTTVIAWYFFDRIRFYCAAVYESVQSVLKGRYGKKVETTRQDEVGQMVQSFNTMLDYLQERERVHNAMNKVVSKEIAEELLKGDIKLGGEIRFASVLFADIRGFSTLAEHLDPQQLVSLVNDCLTLMSKIVEDTHGVVDKYIGDAIMAIFGAPVTHVGDVDNALQAALDIQWTLRKFNYLRAWEGKMDIGVGVGINTGPVIAGNIGSENHLNYTVMGDSVNLASRLQGLTRLYNVNTLVSEFTYHESKRNFKFRELDLVRVKGRVSPVRIFELWNTRQTVPGVDEAFEIFQNARRYYVLRDWPRAEDLFDQVTRVLPGDGPSRLFLSRIQTLRKSPPSESWDGVYTAISK